MTVVYFIIGIGAFVIGCILYALVGAPIEAFFPGTAAPLIGMAISVFPAIAFFFFAKRFVDGAEHVDHNDYD